MALAARRSGIGLGNEPNQKDVSLAWDLSGWILGSRRIEQNLPMSFEPWIGLCTPSKKPLAPGGLGR